MTLDARTIAERLADQAEDVAIALLGPPSHVTARELRWGRRGSLALRRDGAKRGQWFDHERGEGGDMLHLLAREHGVTLVDAMRIACAEFLGAGVEHSVPRPSRAPTVLADDDRARIAAALRLWRESVPIGGTLAERYFIEHRGLDIAQLDLNHVLQWHEREHCIVALMTDATTNEPCGVHRTFLNRDATKRERKMLGRKGVIRLSPDEGVTLGLGLVEGIEDGLAVLLSGWQPVWAAGDAGALAQFPALAGIEALTVFADGDAAGMTAAQRCADRWRRAGKEAQINEAENELQRPV